MPKDKARKKQQADRDRGTARGRPGACAAALLYLFLPLVIAGLMIWYVAFSRQAAKEIGFPLDDSWIHARFAGNLSKGLGFSFNPGEPTSTTTGALWTLVFAAGYHITHEFFFTSFALNWLLCVLLCVVIYHLSLTMHASRRVALLAASTVAVTIPLPWWALSGMEPPLYAFLAVFGILLHVRLRESSRRDNPPPRTPPHKRLANLAPTIVFALAGLARPECLLLFPLAMVDRLLMARWGDASRASAGVSPASDDGEGGVLSRWLKGLALHLALFLVIIAPLFIYNYQVTGYPLPSSFYSKQQRLSLAAVLAGTSNITLAHAAIALPAKELWEVLRVWAGNNAVLIAPFCVGMIWLIRRAFAAGSGGRSLLIPGVLIAQPLIWALVAGYREPGYQSQRYLASLNPLFLLVGVAGGFWLTEKLPWLGRLPVRLALVACVLGASLVRQPAAAKTYGLNVKNITEMQVRIARWLRDNAPRGSQLAVNDVGAIGLITDDPVLDLQGLVTPEALPARAQSYRQIAAGQMPLALSEFVWSRRPDYLVIFPAWYPEMEARRDLLTPVFESRLTDNITCGAAQMVVYRTIWARSNPQP